MATSKSDAFATGDVPDVPSLPATTPEPAAREDILNAREWAERVLHAYGVELVSTFHDHVVRAHVYFDTHAGWEKRYAAWLESI